MGFRFSAAEPEDYADVLRILSWVYNGRGPQPEEKLTVGLGRIPLLVRTDSGEAAAACRIHDYRVARGPRTLRTAGIAAVGALIPHRTHGAAGALMEGALQFSREKGFLMSALFGFRESYYRRFGYEACGWRWRLESRESCLPKVSTDLAIRQGSMEDLPELEAVFDGFIRQSSGAFLRTEADWRHRVGGEDVGLYLLGDPAQAYVALRISGFFGHVEVADMAWSSREGYEAIWAVLRGAAKNQEGVRWTEPPESPFLARFDDHGVTAQVDGLCMHRVVNVPDALLEIRPGAGEGEFTIEVEDDLLPENRGPWRVSWQGRDARVESCAQADIKIGVGPLSQAIMGQPSLAQLAGMGLVESASDEALAAAKAYFGAISVTYMDPF